MQVGYDREIISWSKTWGKMNIINPTLLGRKNNGLNGTEREIVSKRSRNRDLLFTLKKILKKKLTISTTNEDFTKTLRMVIAILDLNQGKSWPPLVLEGNTRSLRRTSH